MTAIVINGQSYDLDDGLAGAELNHLLYLKTNTGLGLGVITRKLQSFGAAAAPVADDEDKQEQFARILDVLDDPETLNAFRGIVWLLRTKNGDRGPDGKYLSIEAANEGVSLTDFGSGDDDEPSAEPSDPTADPTSLDAAEVPAASS